MAMAACLSSPSAADMRRWWEQQLQQQQLATTSFKANLSDTTSSNKARLDSLFDRQVVTEAKKNKAMEAIAALGKKEPS